MTAGASGPEQGGQRDPREGDPVVRDRRRIDPETGQVREQPAGSSPAGGTADADQAPHEPDATAGDPDASASDLTAEDVLAGAAGGDAAVQQLADQRLEDLQRLQAEYVNYRKRVDRDRDVSAASAKSSVFEALLPVLDDVVLARTHGGLSDGPAASIADKLESTLERLGLERYGEAGEVFDPAVHEALMHGAGEGYEVTTVTQVLQPGYRAGGRVLRAARVAVAGPQ
ncbi:nucleotide exchange factor GrpE [uncultured Pseudokineococcus sp.]|uniref:nucleotide exchange factor GrpE n=1 Tax=uncultured Pseudokineococcus sp. TaxID=1642928 RepID=UPI0026063D85|nr:nucleotide exchange factor GrpE [uncultured Pseudokineococcus sp.]